MRENEPVYQALFTRRKPAYLISRYEDVESLLTDPDRIMKNPRQAEKDSGKRSTFWMPKAFRPLMHNMLNTDDQPAEKDAGGVLKNRLKTELPLKNKTIPIPAGGNTSRCLWSG